MCLIEWSLGLNVVCPSKKETAMIPSQQNCALWVLTLSVGMTGECLHSLDFEGKMEEHLGTTVFPDLEMYAKSPHQSLVCFLHEVGTEVRH